MEFIFRLKSLACHEFCSPGRYMWSWETVVVTSDPLAPTLHLKRKKKKTPAGKMEGRKGEFLGGFVGYILYSTLLHYFVVVCRF